VDAIANGSGSFIHGFTYNAHPVCLAAGRVVLQRIREQELVTAVGPKGPVGASLAAELKKLSASQTVGDVRGLGLLWGVELVADLMTKKPFPMDVNFSGRVGQACAKRGLLVYPMQGCVDGYTGDHLLIAPPAIISATQVGWAVEQLQAAIEEVSSAVS
jgi:adenosylmethionine-8-amino-7-oxononanoate aminotransferase